MAIRGVPAKDLGRVSGAEVRIFSPTPNKKGQVLPVLFCLVCHSGLASVRLGVTCCLWQRIFSFLHFSLTGYTA